jgi:hypothetical protein
MRKKLWRLEKFDTRKSTLSWKYVVALFVTLILCILDGILTISLVEKGAWEANPLMRYAISVSYEYFLFSKYFLTASGLLFLFLHGEKKVFGKIFTVEEIAGGIVLFYEGLVIYEITVYHIVK